MLSPQIHLVLSIAQTPALNLAIDLTLSLLFRIQTKKEDVCGGRPEEWSGPIGRESQEAYGKDAVPADAIIGA